MRTTRQAKRGLDRGTGVDGRRGGWRGRLSRLLLGEGRAASMEGFEPRLVMANSPLPSLSALERPENPVVRIEVVAGTLRGDIDIELFADVAPITTQNFINYVVTGRLDTTFFHRRTLEATDSIEVLQGGGFVYDNDLGLRETTAFDPIVRENTGRGMFERSISMARQGGAAGLNTATSQFFINVTANPELDTPGNNQFFSFGRVIGGWDFVVQLGALTRRNLSTDPGLSGPLAGNFSNTPTSDQFSPSAGVRENALVRGVNYELIKAAGATGFFQTSAVFPDGQRTGSTTETLHLYNPNSTNATVQVILRYERNVNRDVVLAQPVLTPGATLAVPLSDRTNSSLDSINSSDPYSIIVQTSVAGGGTAVPVSASVERSDFNARTSETLLNHRLFDPTELQQWDFPRVERNDLSREFVTWVSLSDLDGEVTVRFYGPEGLALTVTRGLDAFRRGGLSVADLGLPTGVEYAARVTSTVPIAAALSDFDLPVLGTAADAAATPGWATFGVLGGGSTAGGFGGAQLRSGERALVSLANPTTGVNVVTLRFWRSGRAPSESPISRSEVLIPNGRFDFVLDGALLGIPEGETFTVTYTATARAAVQYTQFTTTNRNATGQPGDGASSVFSSRVPGEVVFAGQFLDPSVTAAQSPSVLSIFNPFADSGVTFSYQVRFRFSDGTSIDGPGGTLGANQRTDIDIATIDALRTKAGSGADFRSFSVVVTGQGTDGSVTTPTAGLVSLIRGETTRARGWSTSPAFIELGRNLDDAIFGPGGTPD